MKKTFIYFGLIIGILFLGFNCDKNDDEESTFKLSVEKSQNTISLNDVFSVSVNLTNVEDLFAATFEIVFDPEYFLIDDQDIPSPVRGDFFGTSAIFVSQFEEDRISVGIGLTQTDDVDAVTGSGTLSLLSFKVINIGTTELDFANVTLIDETGDSVQNFETLEFVPIEIVVE